jgi:hypothetical protein
MKSTAVVVYTPADGPLANPEFDAQAAAAGLNDVAKTYATNGRNFITNTGKMMLGSLQTRGAYINTSVAVRFVAGSSGAPYINTRLSGGRAIGMFWSGGIAEVFDDFSGWTLLGGLNATLVPGNTYFAKFDVAQTAPTTTTITASFLNPDASVVATQKFTDTTSAAQFVRGPDDVEESPNGLAASEVLVSRGVAPDSFVLQGSLPSPSPSPRASETPTAAPTSTPTAKPTATPTPKPTPSPVPTPKQTPGGVPVSLCIGQPNGPGLVYNLASHDEFDKDVALNTGAPVAGDLNVSDTYAPAFLGGAKQTTWSNVFSFGRENGGLDGTDDSAYPSFADIATWQKEYGASKYPSTIQLDPGVGVKLLAYAAPQPVPSDVQSFLCGDGTCRHNLGGLMDGNINNAYEYGYWVYSAEVPDGRASAPGFWPSDWTLCETVCGTANNYYEMDTFEVFSTLLGQGTFDQTLQPENPSQSSGQSIGPGPITGQQLDRVTNSTIQTQFHQYAELSSPTYVGFWFDNVAESGALNQVPAAKNPNFPGVSPIMVMQTCSFTSYCAPGVGPTEAPGVMTEQYYRHYAPSTTTCGPPYDVPAQPLSKPGRMRP